MASPTFTIFTIQSKYMLWLIRSCIVIIAVLGVTEAMSTFLWSRAKPFTPPEGYIFPREPVLIGTYKWENLPGGRHFGTSVDNVRIFCSPYSYYSATWFSTGSYFDCERKNELDGKPVEAHRVRLPTKNPTAHAVTIKIISNGKTYLDLSDNDIRERWIKETRQSGVFDGGTIVIQGLVFFLTAMLVRKFSFGLNFGGVR